MMSMIDDDDDDDDDADVWKDGMSAIWIWLNRIR